jgi:hypothetical protein
MITTTTPVTADGIAIFTGLVAYDNNMSVVVVTGPAERDGWFPTLRIGGYGTGQITGSSDGSRLSQSFRDIYGKRRLAVDEPREITVEAALRHGKSLWTLVSIAPRARYARPVAGAVVGTWSEAQAQAATIDTNVLLPVGIDVWYVPAEGAQVHPEDKDNLLLDNGRRVPIRWDAKPQIAV